MIFFVTSVGWADFLLLVSSGEHGGIVPTLLVFERPIASCTSFVPLNWQSPVVPRSCLLWLTPISPLASHAFPVFRLPSPRRG